MPLPLTQLFFSGRCDNPNGPMSWGYAMVVSNTGELHTDCGTVPAAAGNTAELAAWTGLWRALKFVADKRTSIEDAKWSGVHGQGDCRAVVQRMDGNEPREAVRCERAAGACLGLLGRLHPTAWDYLPAEDNCLAVRKCNEAWEGLAKGRAA